MVRWDCRGKCWKLGGREIRFYQQVLSVGAKRWRFLCLWQPSIPERCMAVLERRVCSPSANPVVYITALCWNWLETKISPIIFFGWLWEDAMLCLCFLCASCFYLLIKEGEYLGVSIKEMTPNAILSAGNQDSWHAWLTSTAEIFPAKHPRLARLLPRFWQALYDAISQKISVSKAAICRLWFPRS